MRAVVAVRHGGPEALEMREVPEPRPAPGQVAIRVASAGVNFSDLLTLRGAYAGPPPPFVPGIEVAGRTVDSDRPVIALLESGGFGEVAVADERMVLDAEGLDLDRAGGFGLVTLAAYFGLRRAARLQPGEDVLVTAAGGGLGTVAIQVARALGAGRVFGVASTDDKRAAARSAGADSAFGYDDELPPVDVVLDGVGGEAFTRAYRATRRFGRVVTVGSSSGEAPPVPGFQELRDRSVALAPFSFKALRAADPELVRHEAPAGIELIRSGRVVPVVGERLPLERAAEALERLGARRAIGKLVLEVRP
jgi:NADPH2:quinone reductase